MQYNLRLLGLDRKTDTKHTDKLGPKVYTINYSKAPKAPRYYVYFVENFNTHATFYLPELCCCAKLYLAELFCNVTFYLEEVFHHATFYLAKLFRHATFFLAEQFRPATFYLAELFCQIVFPNKFSVLFFGSTHIDLTAFY